MKKEIIGNEFIYTKYEVAKICNCSESKASNIIRGLNKKLLDSGTPKESLIAGKISKKYFHETLKI
jgi:redox-regulated HSP33 family molecular chaperone